MSPLSPAAQAVLDAYGGQVGGSAAITSYERRGIAAALRALADQVACPILDDWGLDVFNRQLKIRAEILAIAAELEGSDD